MSRDSAYLEDMLEASIVISSHIEGITYLDFVADIKCQDAVIRRIGMIGKAANRLSEEAESEFPQLPIRKMISMRHRLVHDYAGIDIPLVWTTANEDIPRLIEMLKQILG